MITDSFEKLAPKLPDPVSDGFSKETDTRAFDIDDVHIEFSGTGGISSLQVKNGWDWASEDNLIGQYVYQVQSTDDFYNFFNLYAQRDENGNIPWFFPMDFGKPGLYGNPLIAQNITVLPELVSLWRKNISNHVVTFLLNLQIQNNTFHESYGAPSDIWVNMTLDTSNGVALEVSLQLFNKTATRLPESMWFRFRPAVPDPETGKWTMSKLNQQINPLDVMVNGSRHLHAVDHGISYVHPVTTLDIASLDASVLSWGDENPFPTPSGGVYEPNLSNGASFCLFANEWGTNYIMWYPFESNEGDLKFRFRVTIQT